MLFFSSVSKESLRFQFSHEQGFDTSCGLSVAATMLDHYWNVPVDEYTLLEHVFAQKEAEVKSDFTVSLADISGVFSLHKLSSRGYEADWNDLRDIIDKGFRPLVIHYDRPDKHFALLIGFNADRAVVVDPAAGLESLSQAQFESRYSGVALAVAAREQQLDSGKVAAVLQWSQQKQARLEEAAVRMGAHW